MVGISGLELTPVEKEILLHPLVGGVILFSRNYASITQLKALTTTIHQLREPHLLIAVDQEGGRVQRFKEGFTQLPPVRRLGELYDLDAKRAKRLANTMGWLMATELRSVGVDLSFAPILDLDSGVSQVIGDRAFHSNASVVANLAHAYMSGMQKSGMAATGKHFPGHGSVVNDTHTSIAVDERRFEDIAQKDMVTFERMIHYGMAAVMVAHVIYSHIDSKPAGFSPIWLRKVLRQNLGFQGVVFSDDLGMEAAGHAGSIQDRASSAIEAGCDMVLVCNTLDIIPDLLDNLPVYNDPASHLRLARLHGRKSMEYDELRSSALWKQAVAAVSTLV